MKLTDRLPSAREKYAKFTNETARILYKRTIHLREIPHPGCPGCFKCQVFRFIDKEEWERPDVKAKYEHGALVIAEANTWKELGL